MRSPVTARIPATRPLLAVLAALLLLVALPLDAAAAKRKPKAPPPPPIDPGLETQLWDILERGTRTGDIAARGVAVEGIAHLRPGESKRYATEAVNDPQWAVRAGGIQGLIFQGDPGWVKAAQEALTSANAEERRKILGVLAEAPLDQALAAIFGVFDAPKAPNKDKLVDDIVARGRAGGDGFAAAIFERACVGQGTAPVAFQVAPLRMGAADAPLLAVAARATDPQVQQNVIEAARKLPAEADVAFLEPLLGAKDEATRVAAAEILATHGAPAAVPVLLPLVEAPEFDTRLRAVHALEGAATPEAATRAVEFFENSEPPPREQLLQMADALFALTGAAGDQRMLPLLQAWLMGTDFEQRTIAARRLGAVQGARALPTLHELLFDGNPQVRTYAAQSLGKLGRSESVPALQKALDDRDPSVRREVAAALAHIKDRAVVDVVSFLISDMDDEVRLSAARALANASHVDALEGLRIALDDRDPRVRLAAFRGMIAIDGKSALQQWPRILAWLEPGELPALARENAASFQSFLEAALASPRPEIRAAAVAATDALGKTDRLALLARLVKEDPQLDVRLAALAALLREQGGAARLMLHDLANDPEPSVRRAAIEALADVGDASTVDVLRAYLVDPDEAIRIGSAAAIATVLTR